MDSVDSIEYRTIERIPGYRFGSDGSIWSRWSTRKMTDGWKLKKPSFQKKRTPGRRYLYLNLAVGGVTKTFRVHRLILEAFRGPCPKGMEARHLNGNPADNRIENLEWGTPEQNRDDCRQHGRYSEMPRNRRFTHDGKTMCLKEWAAHFSIPYQTLYQRVTNLGMSFEEAVTRPCLGIGSNGAHWTKIKREKAS